MILQKRKGQTIIPMPDKKIIEAVDSSTQTPSQTGSSINLTQLKNGTKAKVIEIQGGHKVAAKLDAMEIVPGSVILKKTSTLMRGPVVIEVGPMQLAIGYGMAQKIIVEPLEPGH